MITYNTLIIWSIIHTCEKNTQIAGDVFAGPPPPWRAILLYNKITLKKKLPSAGGSRGQKKRRKK